MTDKLSEQLAKEIAEMSDEAVEVATKKYFTYPLCDCSGLNHTKECPFTGSRYNPCEEINIGVNEMTTKNFYLIQDLYSDQILSKFSNQSKEQWLWDGYLYPDETDDNFFITVIGNYEDIDRSAKFSTLEEAQKAVFELAKNDASLREDSNYEVLLINSVDILQVVKNGKIVETKYLVAKMEEAWTYEKVNELHYNPMEVDEGWEPPKPSHLNELYRMCWDIVNELRDANKVYFVDEIPEEMVKVYDIADMMETWLLKNGSSGA